MRVANVDGLVEYLRTELKDYLSRVLKEAASRKDRGQFEQMLTADDVKDGVKIEEVTNILFY